MKNNLPKHVILTFGTSLVALSQAAILVRIADAPAAILGFWRMLITLGIVFSIMTIKKDHVVWSYTKAHLPRIFMAGFFFWLHFYFWFLAVQNTKVANAVVLFNLNPVFVALGAAFFLKEHITKTLLVALSLGLVGVMIITWGSMQFEPEKLKGDLFAVIAAVCFAAYLLVAKDLRGHQSNLALTYLFNIVTTVCFLILGLLQGQSFSGYGLQNWFGFIGMAIVSSLLGHSLFTYSLKYLKASVASCFKLLEPTLAALSAYFIFGESLSPTLLIGFTFIATGLLNLFYFSRNKA